MFNHYEIDANISPLTKDKFLVHIIGIGGAGMSGIAEIIFNLGYNVQGSDICQNYRTERLNSIGVLVFVNHNEKNMFNASIVLASAAVNNDNVELQYAIKNNIPIIKRYEILGEILKSKFTIAISGSHGKTTTTSFISYVFRRAKIPVSFLNGEKNSQDLTNNHLGNSKYFIIEADESDKTFIKIPVNIAIITNIDKDHLDFYKNFQNVIDSFITFIKNVSSDGLAVVCIDDVGVEKMMHQLPKRLNKEIVTYGIKKLNANVRAFNIRTTENFSSIFDVEINISQISSKKLILKNFTIPTIGEHNILNALAAITISIRLSLTKNMNLIKDWLSTLPEIKKRFEKILTYKKSVILSDYAHHPNEIKATLRATYNIAKKISGRVITIFQPHRYTRTKFLFKDFVHSFSNSDITYVTDIFPAHEKKIKNINSKNLVEKMQEVQPQVYYLSCLKEIPQIIKSLSKKNDIFLLMGAGSIGDIADSIKNGLK